MLDELQGTLIRLYIFPQKIDDLGGVSDVLLCTDDSPIPIGLSSVHNRWQGFRTL